MNDYIIDAIASVGVGGAIVLIVWTIYFLFRMLFMWIDRGVHKLLSFFKLR